MCTLMGHSSRIGLQERAHTHQQAYKECVPQFCSVPKENMFTNEALLYWWLTSFVRECKCYCHLQEGIALIESNIPKYVNISYDNTDYLRDDILTTLIQFPAA